MPSLSPRAGSRTPPRYSELSSNERSCLVAFAAVAAVAILVVIARSTGLADGALGDWGQWISALGLVAAVSAAVMLVVATVTLAPWPVALVGFVGFLTASQVAHAPNQTPATIAEIAVFGALAGAILTDEQAVLRAMLRFPVHVAYGSLVALRLCRVPVPLPARRPERAPVLPAPARSHGTAPTTAAAVHRAPGESANATDDGPASRLVTNLTARARAGELEAAVGRDVELAEIEEVVGQRKPANAALIAQAGSGKTAIAHGLAVRWAASHPERTLLSVDAGGVKASGHGNVGDVERAWQAILAVAKRPGVSLFLDEAHTALADPGAANLLKPALADGSLRVIAASTPGEWDRDVAKDEALARRFALVRVRPVSVELALPVVRYQADLAAVHDGARLNIGDEAVEAAARLAERFVADRALPGSAVALINRAASRATTRGLSEVTPGLVAEVLADQTGVPVAAVEGTGRERLAGLADRLRARVFEQDNAVAELTAAVQAKELGISDAGRPASLIFLGPTGVGKTELVRALADELAPGNPAALVVIEGGKYKEAHRVSELLGAPAGYQDSDKGGLLVNGLRRGARVVLVDEVEKMHPDFLPILLALLDAGSLTDGSGGSVPCAHAIVVLTSNLGATGASSSPAVMERAARDYFPAELWARIAHKVSFRPLARSGGRRVADLFLGSLAERMRAQQTIEVTVADGLRERIVDAGYHPDDGARSLRPVVALSVENALTTALLADDLHSGDAVTVVETDDRAEHGTCVTDAGVGRTLLAYVEAP